MVAQQQQQQQQQWQSGRWTMVAECAGTHGLPLPGTAWHGHRRWSRAAWWCCSHGKFTAAACTQLTVNV